MIIRALLRRNSMLKQIGHTCRANKAWFSLDAIQTSAQDVKSDWRSELAATMKIIPDFITPQEEDSILQEIEPYLKRMRYETSHWDDAIHHYRETERAKWNEHNSGIIERVRAEAFPPGTPQLGLVHVLDLAAEGKIKPHVDSVRFCGDVIAGISLLSDSVMRLTLVGNEKECKQDFFLPRRSLYIMRGAARQKYNHEILGNEESTYNGRRVEKGRRISVICRSEPEPCTEDS